MCYVQSFKQLFLLCRESLLRFAFFEDKEPSRTTIKLYHEFLRILSLSGKYMHKGINKILLRKLSFKSLMSTRFVHRTVPY